MRKRSWRQKLIASAVLGYFVVGTLSLLPKESPIQRVPVLASLFSAFRFVDIEQTWPMFSPPPKTNPKLLYAVQYTNGTWSELTDIASPILSEQRSRFFQPRGYFRLSTHLRVSTMKDLARKEMHDRDSRAYYYQQLCDYLCQGDGAIEGANRVRLYVGIFPMKPYESDEDFSPEDYKELHADKLIYEQFCQATS